MACSPRKGRPEETAGERGLMNEDLPLLGQDAEVDQVRLPGKGKASEALSRLRSH